MDRREPKEREWIEWITLVVRTEFNKIFHRTGLTPVRPASSFICHHGFLDLFLFE